MRYFCDYVSQCIYRVAQDNSSPSSGAQRRHKAGHSGTLWGGMLSFQLPAITAVPAAASFSATDDTRWRLHSPFTGTAASQEPRDPKCWSVSWAPAFLHRLWETDSELPMLLDPFSQAHSRLSSFRHAETPDTGPVCGSPGQPDGPSFMPDSLGTRNLTPAASTGMGQGPGTSPRSQSTCAGHWSLETREDCRKRFPWQHGPLPPPHTPATTAP